MRNDEKYKYISMHISESFLWNDKCTISVHGRFYSKAKAPKPRNDCSDLQSWNLTKNTLLSLVHCLQAPGQFAKNQFPDSQFHRPTFGQMGLLLYFSKYRMPESPVVLSPEMLIKSTGHPRPINDEIQEFRF